MRHNITRELYDAFPPERKSDFWPGYLYLKYTEYFFNKALEISGIPSRELPPLDPGLEEMLEALAIDVSENAGSSETSLYHGKILKLQDALKLVTQKEDVNFTPPERVIPFKVARDVVLENPSSIVVGECPCRAASPNPCLPPGQQEVCLFIGDPWATFMDEQNPKYHRVSPEKATEVLEFCHEKGFVHTAYFEHAAGNRLDAICNCCGCCCMGIRMWNLMEGTLPLLAPSGYVAEVSEDCSGCGICAENVCNFYAISLDEQNQRAVIDFDKCMGCGVCESVCPDNAIYLRREKAKGDPLDLDELLTGQRE
ncbi:MAG: 4Fe-4S dicluster domain-containing protein [Dehalococcoidia bacterium]